LQIKIADFGLARAFSIPTRSYTHEVVTLWYRAPEVLLGQRKYSLPIDVWSVGCIFAELCDGTPLWQGDSEIDQLFRIFRSLGTPNSRHWNDVEDLPDYKPFFPKWPTMPFEKVVTNQTKLTENGADLIKKMFLYHPGQRISARAALEHEYFCEIRSSGSRDSPIVLE
jgi:serine/threonine protein kinase